MDLWVSKPLCYQLRQLCLHLLEYCWLALTLKSCKIIFSFHPSPNQQPDFFSKIRLALAIKVGLQKKVFQIIFLHFFRKKIRLHFFSKCKINLIFFSRNFCIFKVFTSKKRSLPDKRVYNFFSTVRGLFSNPTYICQSTSFLVCLLTSLLQHRKDLFISSGILHGADVAVSR